MNMLEACVSLTAAVLDGNIVVCGGRDNYENSLSSMDCIDICDLLECAPLHYPLPSNTNANIRIPIR